MYGDGFKIRQTKPSELQILEDFFAQEGLVSCDFNVAFDSIEDKSGFFTGEYEGLPVCFIMFYKWSDNPIICYGGAYICDATYRNKSFGRRIFEVVAELYHT